jgi:hypothetical protein
MLLAVPFAVIIVSMSTGMRGEFYSVSCVLIKSSRGLRAVVLCELPMLRAGWALFVSRCRRYPLP